MNLVEEKIQNLFTEILLSTSQVPLLPRDLFKPTQLVITHPSELKNMIVFSPTCFITHDICSIGTSYCYLPLIYLSFPCATLNKYMTYFPTRS